MNNVVCQFSLKTYLVLTTYLVLLVLQPLPASSVVEIDNQYARSLNSNINVTACNMALINADADNDRKVNATEYITFLQELGPDGFVSEAEKFRDLPFHIENVFIALACKCANGNNDLLDCCKDDNAHLSTLGAAAFEIPDQDQANYLFETCLYATKAINFEVGTSAPTDTTKPTVEPTILSSTIPTTALYPSQVPSKESSTSPSSLSSAPSIILSSSPTSEVSSSLTSEVSSSPSLSPSTSGNLPIAPGAGGEGLSAGPLAGIIIGASLLAAAAIAVAILRRRRRRSDKEDVEKDTPDADREIFSIPLGGSQNDSMDTKEDSEESPKMAVVSFDEIEDGTQSGEEEEEAVLGDNYDFSDEEEDKEPLDDISDGEDSVYLSDDGEEAPENDGDAMSPEEREIRDLIRELMPENIENIEMMLLQFKGRENELLETLRAMKASSKAFDDKTLGRNRAYSGKARSTPSYLSATNKKVHSNIDDDSSNNDNSSTEKPSSLECNDILNSDDESDDGDLYIEEGNMDIESQTATDEENEAAALERERIAAIRSEILALMQKLMPDNVGNIDAMMEQFKGREDELLESLQMMDKSNSELEAQTKGYRNRSSGGHYNKTLPAYLTTGLSERNKKALNLAINSKPSNDNDDEDSHEEDFCNVLDSPSSISEAADTEAEISDAESERIKAMRSEIESLVRKLMPENVKNIDAMMEQFKGREEELLESLQIMEKNANEYEAQTKRHRHRNRRRVSDDQSEKTLPAYLTAGIPRQNTKEIEEAINAETSTDSRDVPSQASSPTDTEQTDTDMENSNDLERERIRGIRSDIETLLEKLMPENLDSLDAMMEQFKGREDELLDSLQMMEKNANEYEAQTKNQRSRPRSSVSEPKRSISKTVPAYLSASQRKSSTSSQKDSAASSSTTPNDGSDGTTIATTSSSSADFNSTPQHYTAAAAAAGIAGGIAAALKVADNVGGKNDDSKTGDYSSVDQSYSSCTTRDVDEFASVFEDESDSEESMSSETFNTNSVSAITMTTDQNSSNPDAAATTTDKNGRTTEEIRSEVEALVSSVVPGEFDNIDNMMQQFKGREDELLDALKEMKESSAAFEVQVQGKQRSNMSDYSRSGSDRSSGHNGNVYGKKLSSSSKSVPNAVCSSVSASSGDDSDSIVTELTDGDTSVASGGVRGAADGSSKAAAKIWMEVAEQTEKSPAAEEESDDDDVSGWAIGRSIAALRLAEKNGDL